MGSAFCDLFPRKQVIKNNNLLYRFCHKISITSDAVKCADLAVYSIQTSLDAQMMSCTKVQQTAQILLDVYCC